MEKHFSFISSTFDEETCKALLGTEMPGTIAKIDSDPYEYIIKETGEIIILSHRYSYVPEGTNSNNEDKSIKKLFADEDAFQRMAIIRKNLLSNP